MEVIDSLQKNNVDYALIGGFAMVLHGMPRTTQDVDLFVRPEDGNIKRLVAALNDVFHDESVNEISLKELEKYPVIRFGTKENFFIDIMVKIGDAFTFNDIDYQTVTIEGHNVKIATLETLYKLKKDTVRPIDKTDSMFLMDLIARKGK